MFVFIYIYVTPRNIKIFIGSDDPDTRKEFSELCGQKKVKNFSVNTNAENPASSNTGAANQPLITVGMLERLNGDKKGDAIVSVRGYEPIWTKFTPSYELKGIYFKDGKAPISKREAVLFEKDNYVYDIMQRNGKSEEEMLLEMIEATEEKENAEEIAERKRLAELDKQWQSIVDEIDLKLQEFVNILKGKDAKAVLEADLANKTTLLYAIMDDYDRPKAQAIQEMADKIAKDLIRLKNIQNQAVK